jgi:hypothetical protein
MGNWRHIIKNTLPGLLMLVGAGMYGQEDRLDRAGQLYRAREYSRAAKVIDSAVVDPQTSSDFVTWTTRAFIYYYIYLPTDKAKLNSPLRDTVLISIRKSITLNPDSDYVANNKRLLLNLAAHYFNISKNLLQDSLNYDRSLVAYTRYKELLHLNDASANVNAKDVEYFMAVGSVFSDIFNKDNKNKTAENIAKVALLKVLELQPDNPSANMNLGLLYYNQAANLSRDIDYLIDLEQLDVVQDNMVKLAKQGEQFILKVWMNDNKNKKAAAALYYIYRILNENAKSEDFKKKAIELGYDFSDKAEEENKKINESKDK